MGFVNFCIAIPVSSVILIMRNKFCIKRLNTKENRMFWFFGESICYSNLFFGTNLLALMFCGIFFIRAIMLWSFWMTAMVIKTIPYPIRPWGVLIKLISSRRSLKRLVPGVISCIDIISIVTINGIMLVCSWFRIFTCSLSFKIILLILGSLSSKGIGNSLRFRIWWLFVDNDAWMILR